MTCKTNIAFFALCGHFQTLQTHAFGVCELAPNRRPAAPGFTCTNILTRREFIADRTCDFCRADDDAIDYMSIDMTRSDLGVDVLPQEVIDTRVREQLALREARLREQEENPSFGREFWGTMVDLVRFEEEIHGVELRNQTLIYSPYSQTHDLLAPIRGSNGDIQISSSSSDEKEADICEICQEPFKVGEDIRQLPCSQRKCVFHYTCINTWLTDNDTCPHCRHRFNLARVPDFGVFWSLERRAREFQEESSRRRRHRPSEGRNSWPLASQADGERNSR